MTWLLVRGQGREFIHHQEIQPKLRKLAARALSKRPRNDVGEVEWHIIELVIEQTRQSSQTSSATAKKKKQIYAVRPCSREQKHYAEWMQVQGSAFSAFGLVPSHDDHNRLNRVALSFLNVMIIT
jgi:hypothetical protein